MHNQPPPSSSGGIQPPGAPAANPNNQLIYWDASIAPNPSAPQFNDESRDPAGIWSVGGSTTVSLSGHQVALDDDTGFRSTLSRHFYADIETTHTDILLVICAFVSGLVDGLAFNAWGSFASMQTGNAVFLALGVSGQPSRPEYRWAKSLISLATYMLSSITFIRVSRALGPRRRLTMVLSFGVQTALLFIAAMLIQCSVVSPEPEDVSAPMEWMQALPIALLAFQAGGQICASRTLGIEEIPTVVLTTLICDLLVDPQLLAKTNYKRNRRAAAFLALFVGAMTAGGLTKITEMVASLWFAMGLKLGITIAWLVWKPAGGRKKDVEG
ncbi:YoaK family protein [Aspergillus candidus]|uniref:DUF1275 domain protein n=1 Tax=Aspergillus candidus TaxID=41067 RepID=A0A2I2F2N4_ASPCN|nr:hypothetical protein BDW47DRAFT_111425 [Aspergillus candidus]PLB34890.1 hypothetical protein BDW47DRAFT_111425 [Aspergillus candidus]